MSQAIKSTKAKIIWAIVLIFTFSLIGVIVTALNFDVSKDKFARSVTDTFLTAISVSVIGTLITLLLDDYHREQQKLLNDYDRNQSKLLDDQRREQAELDKKKEKRQMHEENMNQYRKDVLAELNKLYTKTKNARRILRAKGFSRPYYKNEDDDNLLMLSVYDDAMADINNSQLALELIKEEITTNKSAFSNAGLISANIKKMEEFLGEFVSEYEKSRPAFSGQSAALRIGDLKEIKRLLAHADDGGFITDFSEKCNEIRRSIRNDINFSV